MRKINKYTKLLVCVTSMIIILGICGLPMFSIQVQASTEINLLQTAVSHLMEKVETLQTQMDTHIQSDVGISKIEKTATEGNIDTYTITFTNGTTYNFTVTNGQNGMDGKDGKDGESTAPQTVNHDGTSSSMVVIAIIIASIALIGNMIMAVLMVKNKKIKIES